MSVDYWSTHIPLLSTDILEYNKHNAKATKSKNEKCAETVMCLLSTSWTVASVCQEMRPVWWMLKPVHPQWAAAPQSAPRAQERHGSRRKSCRSARQLCWSPPLTSRPWASAAPRYLLLLLHQQCYRWECGFIPIWKSSECHRVKKHI